MEIVGVLKLPGGKPAPWKDVMDRAFMDIESAMEKENQRLVFLWDEVPFMMEHIMESDGEKTAMELLDTLRGLLQTCTRIRVVLTGSIGLHHSIRRLQKKGYNGSPLNNLEPVTPGPLTEQDACILVRDLLEGEKIHPETGCVEHIAQILGNVPFYIHSLISKLPRNGPLTPQHVDHCLRQEIGSANESWDLRHYRTRIPIYYGVEKEPVVLAVLDTLASTDTSLEFKNIVTQVGSSIPSASQETIRDLLRILEQDHYIMRPSDRHYQFRLEVIRQWWKLERDL
jgi:hypothetical protein